MSEVIPDEQEPETESTLARARRLFGILGEHMHEEETLSFGFTNHRRNDNGGQEFVLGIEWGKEAPDSPMAGAAAYGVGPTVLDALEQALGDAGWLR